MAACLAVALYAQAAAAFEETSVGNGDRDKAPAAPVLELPKAPDGAKGLNLSGSELTLRTPGTEVRIPGLGTVGVLPKLDFGLELLYGANEPKGIAPDKSDTDDVQIRGTIKHRF